MLKRTKPLRRRVLTEEHLAKSSKTQHLENTDKWHFCNVKQVVFRTVNHRGPLPLKELHSTGETIVWRDPWGSWACLPVNSPRQRLWHRQWRLCNSGRFSSGESPRIPPLEGTSLHRRNESVERPWGILSLFTTCFHLKVNLHWRE